jgi:hypothetical protein
VAALVVVADLHGAEADVRVEVEHGVPDGGVRTLGQSTSKPPLSRSSTSA